MRSYDNALQRLLVISPVKDEAEYLDRTIRSMVAQAHLPEQWVIVDDGSSDATGAIADAAAREHPWIKVVHRARGTARRVGPGVVEAFDEGLRQADLKDYEFLCKLDGDLEFPPEYFATLLRRFAADPRLGTISGKTHIPVGGDFVPARTVDDFSHGVAKLYRRACFEEIGGFVPELMWDGIDGHRCRMLGWKAISDPDPALAIRHLRRMDSSSRSVYHGRVRWGRGQYFMGTHPLDLLGISACRMFERPWVFGGLCILWGYLEASFRHRPRPDDRAFRRHLHRWQMLELSRRLAGRPAEATPTSTSTVPARPNFRFGWASRGVARRPRTRKARVQR